MAFHAVRRTPLPGTSKLATALKPYKEIGLLLWMTTCTAA